MKKFLVVLLALAMVFGLGSVAFAADTQIADYADLAGVPAEQQAAIYRLTALGVLAGDGVGGDFRPEDTITRAEFAKIAIFLAGKADAVDLYASFAPAYADVQDGTWYEGYVNAAVAFGYMKGYTDGTFKPGQTVTMQEVATVLLRIAGYTDALKGTWPNDYIRKANDTEIIAYVDFVGPRAATRAEVASIANETLDLYMVTLIENEVAAGLGQIISGLDYEVVDEDGFAYIKGKTNEDAPYETVLAYAFEAEVDTKVFELGRYVETSGWDFEDYAKGELHFVFTTGEEEVASDYYIFGADLFNVAAHEVELTIIDKEVIFAEILSERIAFDKYDATKDQYDGTEYDLAAGVTDAANNAYGYIWVGSDAFNNEDEIIAIVEMAKFENDAKGNKNMRWDIVKEVEFDDEDVTLTTEAGLCDEDVDTEEIDETVIFIKDGEFVTFEDLAEEDVLFYLGNVANDKENDEYHTYLVVSPVEGEMNKLYTQKVAEIKIDDVVYSYEKIDTLYSDDNGKTYGEAKYTDMYADDLEDILYVPHYAWKNVATIIADIDDETEDIYAIVLGYETKSVIDEESLDMDGYFMLYDKITAINVLTEKGEEVTYAAEDFFTVATTPQPGDAILVTVDEDAEIVSMDIVAQYADTMIAYELIETPYGNYYDESVITAPLGKNGDDAISGPLKVKANGKVTVGDEVFTITEDTVIMAIYSDCDLKAADCDSDAGVYGWNCFEKAELLDVEEVLGTTMEFDYAYASKKAGTTKVEYIYVVEPALAAKAGDVKLDIAVEHYQSKKVEYVELLDGTQLTIQDKTEAITSFEALEHGTLDNLVAFYCLADEELTTFDATKTSTEKVNKGEFVWLWDANYINDKVDAGALFTKFFDDDNTYTVVVGKIDAYSSDLDEITIGEDTLYVDGVKAIDLTDDCEEVTMKRAYKDAETVIVVYGADNTVVAAYITDATLEQ